MSIFSLSNLAYRLCWCGFLLSTVAKGTQTPATVTLSNLLQTYNGAPKTPTVTTVPADLPTQITYRNLSPTAPAPVSEVVYNDTPTTLFPSYSSYGFQANGLTALGNLIQLGGTARKLTSCEVILVNSASTSNWPALAAANPSGFTHPVTIGIYQVTSTNEIIFLTESTQNILIPWYSPTNPDGSPNSYNGIAFRANISFAAGITLPERVLVVVSYNTESYGFSPLAVPGPYNSLNVSRKVTSNVTPVGSDVDPDVILQVASRSPNFVRTWYYPSTGYTSGGSAPMVRIYALSSESTAPPTNAGTWQASAKVSNSDYVGSTSNTFTIQPATAVVQLSNLTQIIDGSPKPVTITTDPPNLAVSTNYSNTTYPSSPTAPNAIGLYTVQSQTTNPNYLGSANAELSLIGHSLTTWLNQWVLTNQIPAAAADSDDDPDQDSLPNLVEYALALDPSTANHGVANLGIPQAQYSLGQLSLIYRKNLAATDLTFQVESAAQLGESENWSPAVTTDEVMTTVGVVQNIRATMPVSPDESRRFMRLRITRQETP